MQPPSASSNGKRKQQLTYGKQKRRLRPFRLPLDDEMFHPPNSQLDSTQSPDTNPPKIPPRPPPKSQKEATMIVQPSSEDIAQFQDITGADYATAVKYIRVKQGRVADAINALLDGDDISKEEESMTWDDDLFARGRDGQKEGEGLLRPLGAPTAPNTRENSPHPTTKAEEDAQVRLAMANSMGVDAGQYEGACNGAGSGLWNGQETGRVGSDGKEVTFGPATKDTYDASQWAMVPTTNLSASEVVPDVDAEGRRNAAGGPRFIKPLAAMDGDYLPNVLTICHAIAGVREAMLMRGSVRAVYGEDAEWWKGHKISMPRIVHTDSGEPVDPNADAYDELKTEVQRLMAFLDTSDRSYASASGLMQLDALKDKDPDPAATPLSMFLTQWVYAATIAKNDGDASSLQYAEGDAYRLFKTKRWGDQLGLDTIDLKCEAQVPEGEAVDLIEMLDDAVWGNTDAQSMTARDRNVDQPAEVLILRLKHADKTVKQLRVSVPAEFYMDKYLKENTEATMAIRQQVAQGKTRIRKMTELEKKLTTWKHPNKNEHMDARELLKHTHGVFSGQNRHDVESNGLPNGTPADEITPPHHQELAQKLEKVMASIDSKLTLLASEKEKTRKAIAEMSRNPLTSPESQLRHHYTLRGVSTKPSTTYILLPKEEQDEADPDDDQAMLLSEPQDEDTPEGMQWWRIEYEVTPSGTGANVSKIKMDGQTVLRAVELEFGSAVVVYASDRVNDIALYDPGLPAALQEFVERDNELFRSELREAAAAAERERARAAPPAYDFGGGDLDVDVPRQSIERKGSMDSLRAQGEGDGPSPPGYENDEFMGHHAFGLGPNIKEGRYLDAAGEDEEGPVHEITLDEPAGNGGDVVMDGDGSGEDGREMEMLERKGHASLIPGLGGMSGGGDATMEDVGSQDDGVGGSTSHVEDAEGGVR